MNDQESKDILWVSTLVALSLLYCIVTHSSVFLSSILIAGILCVALTAVGRKEGYLIGIYNSCAYAWISYQNGLFGEVSLNLLFFVPTGIVGFFMWKQNMVGKVVSMRSLSIGARYGILALCFLSIIVLGWLLSKISTQNTPYIDASTNVFSVVATFLMMWRFKEQWILYMLINVISIFMWFLRWLDGGLGGDLMVLLWSLYLVNSVFGYWRWNQGIKFGHIQKAVNA